MIEERPLSHIDFFRVASALVDQLMDRVPSQWRPGLASEVKYGIQEPEIFLRNLIPLFTEDRVSITPSERDTVVRLMKDQRIDLAVVGEFNVVEDPYGRRRAE